MANKTLKEKAWKIFGLYIKLRDANEYGFCTCCTCGKVLPFDSKKCHAGHFVPGRGNAVLFNDKIVHAQCSECNFNSGEQARYMLFMKRSYGYSDNDIEVILKDKKAVLKLTDACVENVIVIYYTRVMEMLRTKYKDNGDIEQRVSKKIKSFCMKTTLIKIFGDG